LSGAHGKPMAAAISCVGAADATPIAPRSPRAQSARAGFHISMC
jgi:hypothetical protein